MMTGAAVDLGQVDLGGVTTGSFVTILIGLIVYTIRLLLNRFVPSRTDKRDAMTQVLEGLNKVIVVLQQEKSADAERLLSKEKRIQELEDADHANYNAIRELRAEIIELQSRLAVKDQHIRTLTTQLRKLGATVTGRGDAFDDLEVTLPADQVRAIAQSQENS